MEEERHRSRVLVVDDDPTLIALISDGLEMVGGYEVLIARDGATGLKQVFEGHPDCLVVDVRMPGLNGFQLVRALRGDPETAEMPIVVLSALVQDREQIAGMMTGADAYLLKPVRLNDLLQTIETSVRMSADERRKRTAFLTGEGSVN